ncbi:His Kinase A (phospho-acceptor) domain-containing protein [Granulicella pectinivorans]|uniref:histidine kinase n=2 Tax=Granulicella pectinivorans TaxID=474950 RepID=A0A1I6LBQ6_9BACT|nr:His Kinase A (phospho-acceptor) domain-containing protein [Granulicella pectinivorans]
MGAAMKLKTTRALVPFLLFGAVIVVALNAWFAFRSVQVLVQGEMWMQHTWQVILQVEKVMSSAKDAETGNRGYLITGDDAYLEPYHEALADLPAELNTFASLTSDNASQQARLVELRAILQQRIALLKQGIALKKEDNGTDVQLMVLSGTGKAEMDHMRKIADDMEAEERTLLAVRTRQTDANVLRARLTIGVASAIDFLLIVLMFRYLARERSLRIATEEAAEKLAVARLESEAKAEEVRLLNLTLEERVRLRTAELETTNRELEAFSYSVSHDLRAPLRTIDGFSLALEEDYAEAVDATGRDYIKRVRTGVQRMGMLIDSLLQLSRITRAEIQRGDADLSQIAEGIVSNLQEENPGRDIEFRIQPGLKTEADPKLLQVALENLLGNAVKFSAKVPHAVIEFGWDEQEQAWFVKDNGAGFDMFYKDKLFNAFNRLHGDKDFKGSGIGLATVARVVRRHHGRIWADAVVDHGATFWFTLG